MDRVEELKRVTRRIADLERTIATAQDSRVPTISGPERTQVLDLLKRTLSALRAREQFLERQTDSG